MAKGVSLLELVVGMVVTGGVTLAIVNFSSNAMQAQKNSNLRSQTEQKMRLFLETQKEKIALSLPNAPDPNNNCKILDDSSPPFTKCKNKSTFNTLKLSSFKDPLTSTGPFFDTTQTECIAAPVGVANSSALKTIRECTPCTDKQIPVVRTRRNTIPGLVLRFSGDQEKDNSIADDGSTLASALCITHNALVNPLNPSSFTLLNLRLRTLVLQTNEPRLLEISASIPTPRLQPGGVRVLSSGGR